MSFRGWRGGPGGDAIDVQLFGAETQVLKEAALAVQTALGAYPEVSALEDTLAYDRDEMILELTPQGRALGFEIGSLGRVLRDRLNGIEAATFPEGVRTAAIRVELPEGELTADFLDRTLLRAVPAPTCRWPIWFPSPRGPALPPSSARTGCGWFPSPATCRRMTRPAPNR